MTIALPLIVLLSWYFVSRHLAQVVRFAVEQSICYVQQAHVTPLRNDANEPLDPAQAAKARNLAIDAAQIILGMAHLTMLRMQLLRWNLRPWLAVRIEAILYQLKQDEKITTSKAGWQARNPALAMAIDSATQLLSRHSGPMRPPMQARAGTGPAPACPFPGPARRPSPCDGSP